MLKVRILYFHGMYRSVPHFVQVKFKPLTVDVKLRRVKFSLFKQAANGGINHDTLLCHTLSHSIKCVTKNLHHSAATCKLFVLAAGTCTVHGGESAIISYVHVCLGLL